MKEVLVKNLNLILEKATLEGNSQVILFGKEDRNLLAWMTSKNVNKAAEIILEYINRVPHYPWYAVDIYVRGNESQTVVCESLAALMGEPYTVETERGLVQIIPQFN